MLVRNEVFSTSFVSLHALALLVTAVSFLCISLIVFLHYRNMKGAVEEYRRIAFLAFFSVLIFGFDSLIDFAAVLFDLGFVAIVAYFGFSLAAAACAIAICIQLPKLSKAPLSKELVETNQQLMSERKARNEVVETLIQLNNELEERVSNRTRQLEEAKRRFEFALAGTNITMIEQDRQLRYTWIHNPPTGFPADDIIGQRPEEIQPKPSANFSQTATMRVLETGAPEVVEVSIDIDGETRWFEERLEPVLKDDEIAGVVTVAIDITPHKRYEQHLHRLLREITHRSKNLLAVVQGIARQTAESVATPQQFIARFGARLQALSGAHDLLVSQAWQGVELRDLIMREMETYLPTFDVRIGVAGESEILGVEVAQNLALGLHEMASNAITFGSLSNTTGRVDIAWQRVMVTDRQLVELTWIESGGPTVADPVSRGFGRTLIERLVPRAIEGDSEVVFDPSGLRWRLRFPVERQSETV